MGKTGILYTGVEKIATATWQNAKNVASRVAHEGVAAGWQTLKLSSTARAMAVGAGVGAGVSGLYSGVTGQNVLSGAARGAIGGAVIGGGIHLGKKVWNQSGAARKYAGSFGKGGTGKAARMSADVASGGIEGGKATVEAAGAGRFAKTTLGVSPSGNGKRVKLAGQSSPWPGATTSHYNKQYDTTDSLGAMANKNQRSQRYTANSRANGPRRAPTSSRQARLQPIGWNRQARRTGNRWGATDRDLL